MQENLDINKRFTCECEGDLSHTISSNGSNIIWCLIWSCLLWPMSQKIDTCTTPCGFRFSLFLWGIACCLAIEWIFLYMYRWHRVNIDDFSILFSSHYNRLLPLSMLSPISHSNLLEISLRHSMVMAIHDKCNGNYSMIDRQI